MFPGWRVWLLGAVICALAAPWWNIPRDQADSAGMLAHLHALFVDADLLFDDEYAALRMSPLFAFVTDQGVVSNHWPAGASWIQAPGYGLGVLASHMLEALGIGRASSLGVVPVLGVRALAMLVLVATAVGIARVTAAAQPDADPRAARRVGWAVAACFVLGTPLLYYAAEAPLRPHLWGAACTLALVVVWQSPRRGAPWARTVVMASLAGLATYVRPQLGPVWLLVAHDAWTGPDRGRQLLVGAAAFAPWPLAHLRAQAWLYGDGLLAYGGEVTHHTSYFLLSTHHGALPWCPVLLLMAAALAGSALRRERGAWLVVAIVVWQIWLDGGMRAIEPRTVLGTRTWAGGVSFGPRKLVDVLPLLLPAVASAVARVRARGWGRGLALVAALLCLPSVLLLASAWIDPDATTGGIMGSAEYRDALRRPLDGSWSTAWTQRRLPLSVPLVVTACVTLPLLLLGLGLRSAWRRGAASSEPLRGPAVAGLVAALLVHAWLAVVLVRSDEAREADPSRMLEAAARLTPAHLATVSRIEAHHEQLRARLGPGAAPPPR